MTAEILTKSKKCSYLDVEYSTANRLIGQLEEDGVLEEFTGKKRNRFYRASEVFEIINKPIDQL